MIDSKFLNLFIKATEKAAIGASKFIGKKVDANLVHAVVYAVLYFVVTPLI